MTSSTSFSAVSLREMTRVPGADRAAMLAGEFSQAFGLLGLLVSPFAALSLRWGIPLSLIGIFLASWSMVRQTRQEKPRTKPALTGYLIASLAFITAVVVTGLTRNVDTSADEIFYSGVLVGSEEVAVAGDDFLDKNWQMESAQLSVNEVGLLSGVVTVTNTSDSYKSGSFIIEVGTSDRGMLEMIGTTTNLAPGESADVEVLASGTGKEPRLISFNVFAEY